MSDASGSGGFRVEVTFPEATTAGTNMRAATSEETTPRSTLRGGSLGFRTAGNSVQIEKRPNNADRGIWKSSGHAWADGDLPHLVERYGIGGHI